MDIKIDESVIQAVLDKQTTAGIAQAFAGYSIQEALATAVSGVLLPKLLGTAVELAADHMDLDTLAQHLGEELARSVTKGMQYVIREALVKIVMDLHKVPEYDSIARKKAHDELMATIFK